jgi:TRAP transporter TAXI family solute receptor
MRVIIYNFLIRKRLTHMKIVTASFLVLFTAFVVGHACAEELILSAGPADSDTARIGSVLARIMSGDTAAVRMVESKDDTETIEALFSGSTDLAVVDSLSAYEASLGIGRFSAGRKKGLLAAAVVGLLVDHFLLATSAEDPEGVTALSGKMLYLGPDDDPDTYAARTIISSLGIASFYEVGFDWNYDTAAELMIDGTFDGAVFSGIVPVAPVSHVTSIMGRHVTLLQVSGEDLAKIRGQWPIWFPYVVAEKTYPSVDEAYETIARPILLLAAQKLDRKTVTALLVRLFSEPGNSEGAALSYKIDPSMTPAYCPIRLHPGAADYFKGHGR